MIETITLLVFLGAILFVATTGKRSEDDSPAQGKSEENKE